MKAALAASGKLTGADARYSAQQYEIFAKSASSIMGVECEHRVLGRVIGNMNPANNLTYEGLDGLQSIYNGSHSAVVALTPFLTSSTGPWLFPPDRAVQRSHHLSPDLRQPCQQLEPAVVQQGPVRTAQAFCCVDVNLGIPLQLVGVSAGQCLDVVVRAPLLVDLRHIEKMACRFDHAIRDFLLLQQLDQVR